MLGIDQGFASLITADLNERVFAVRLEKHIKDYRSGKGNLSRDIAGMVNFKDNGTSSRLASMNPRAATMYEAYSTSMRYDKRARYINSMHSLAQNLSAISRVA